MIKQQVLNWSGLPVVHVRPTTFLDNPLFTVLAAHSIRDNDTLTLVDRSGGVVGLAYLGLVPQHMMAPFVRLLTVLADPWINASADNDHSLPFEFGEYRGSEVAVVPAGVLVVGEEPVEVGDRRQGVGLEARVRKGDRRLEGEGRVIGEYHVDRLSESPLA